MTRSSVLALLALAAAAAPRGACAGPEVMASVTSSSGKIAADLVNLGDGRPRRILLREPRSTGPGVELCDVEGWAEVFFSPPDDGWIAVNDEMGSNAAVVRLFKRDRGLHFVEQKQLELSGDAWAFLEKTTGRRLGTTSHAYVWVRAWLPDARGVLLVVRGDTEEGEFVRDWLCVYDLEHRRFTLDLHDLNSGRVTGPRNGK